MSETDIILPNGMSTRQLDAFLAERLFGLKVVAMDWPCGRDPECDSYGADMCPDDGIATWYDERGPVVATCEDWLRTTEDGKRFACVEPVEFYSTTWEGMGMIVEAMKAQGFTWACELFADNSKFTGYFKHIVSGERYRDTHDEAPIAVALAAKAAIEGEVTTP